MTTRFRLAGTLIMLGIIIAVVWRVAIAPAVLGDFDPADMPHRDRAFLSIGNIGVAILFAFAMSIISQQLEGASTERLARTASVISLGGAVMATFGTIGLIWTEAAIYGLDVYVVCTGLAWALCGYAIFQRYRGGLGWAALVTGVVYGIAAVAIFAGAFIIFIMTVAALPLAIALIVTGPAPAKALPAI